MTGPMVRRIWQESEHQRREQAVPCSKCGFTFDRVGIPTPRTWTWNLSCVCDAHEPPAGDAA